MKPLIFFISLFVSCQPTITKKVIHNQNSYTAKVIGISDGDTVTVLKNKQQIKIRLAHIDCPEKRQPFGTKAKQFVSDAIFGKMVTVVSDGTTDRWKRLIAVIKYDNNQNLNKNLVRNGLAMHFKRYSDDMSYDVLEQQAKQNKVGMWSQNKVIAPWDFRKQ